MSTGMRFYRHLGDGSICWTYPTDQSALHYRSPRPHERPAGVTHCGYRHNNPAFVTELPEADARTLLANPDRDTLTQRIYQTLDAYFITATPVIPGNGNGDTNGNVSPRALSAQIADRIILADTRNESN